MNQSSATVGMQGLLGSGGEQVGGGGGGCSHRVGRGRSEVTGA